VTNITNDKDTADITFRWPTNIMADLRRV